MYLLEAEQNNCGPIKPGSREKRIWYIYEDGRYQYTEVFRHRISGWIRQTFAAKEMSPEQFETLKELLHQEWSEEKGNACDGFEWKFTMYDHLLRKKHRPAGCISGMEPFESITAKLMELVPKEEGFLISGRKPLLLKRMRGGAKP